MRRLPLEKILVLDGGFGTALQNFGFNIEGDPLWSTRAVIDDPDLVVRVHKEFLAAGAQIISTNSYQANISLISKHSKISAKDGAEVLRRTVDLAERAIQEYSNEAALASDAKIYLAGSIGPYATTFSDCSEYTGSYLHTVDEKTIEDYYFGQASVLAEGGTDVLAFETIPALVEAKSALRALDRLPAATQAWISFSCKNGHLTNFGDLFEKAVSEVSNHPKVIAVGANCSPKDEISQLLDTANGHSHGKPFVVYPNARNISDGGAGLKELARSWIQKGAKIIGGCCDFTFEDIKKLSETAQQINSQLP